MKIGSLFSGIGGLELGLAAGLGDAETVWQVERDPYCREVLARHWPEARRFDNVETIEGRRLEPVDLICGGFPCQDVSSAGKGAGLAGARSGLWYQFARILGECRPEWAVVENVASGASRWVDAVRSDLERIGYETLPIPLSARDVGAPHRRARVFIIAHTKRHAGRVGPRGCSGQGRPGPALSRQPSEARDASDADDDREHAVTEHGQVARTPKPGEATTDADRSPSERDRRTVGTPKGRAAEGRGYLDSNPWRTGPTVPVVCGVDDGVSHRAHRLRALGNAVVPQCAEVIGAMINELR